MGNLKPGVTYIYERSDDTVFRREFGASEREVVGYDHRTTDSRPLYADVVQDFQNIESGNYSIDTNIQNLIYAK
jgi:hypothetical protein